MKIKLFFAAFFASAFFAVFFPNICLGGQFGENLLLKSIYSSKSKNSDSYLVWFKFNRKPDNILKTLGLKGYSLELTFKNAESGINSKFIKFKDNRLFKAAEIVPHKNSGFDAIIYFHKNIKVNKKDTFVTFYGNYFIVKINHTFSGDLFKNVGKEFSAQKNNIKQAVKAVKPSAPAVNAAGKDAAKDVSSGVLKPSSLLSKRGQKLNMGFEAVKTTVYLALIIGLIYGVYFLMNKFKNRVSVKEKVNNLKIVSSINLGNKKSILLIEVNKDFFLVGVSQSNIQVIGHLKGGSGSMNLKTAFPKVAENGDVAGINADAGTGVDTADNTYAEAAFISQTPEIKSYGKFADAMREQVNVAGAGAGEPFRKIRMERYADTNEKIKNINEAKFKNKADNVFFDIEERLKGLMESNGNSKKF